MPSLTHFPEIRPDIAGSEFFLRLKEIVQGLDGHEVLSEAELPDGATQMDLTAQSQGHRGVLRLFYLEGGKGITVHLMDTNSALSPSEYHAAVRILLAPLLRSYRGTFGGRVRWWAPRPPLSRQHSPGAQKIFDAFKVTRNPEGLDGIDWAHFYEFVIYCHDYNVKLESSELKQLLLDSGFTEAAAKGLLGAYEHGRAILRLQRKARDERAWARVIARGGRFGSAHNEGPQAGN